MTEHPDSTDAASDKSVFEQLSHYDDALNRGLAWTGESKYYFVRGRIADLFSQLPADFQAERILDFGCGIGDTTEYLVKRFPQAVVVGVDASEPFILDARRSVRLPNVSFLTYDEFQADTMAGFDLCYANGVFHHILPEDRAAVLANIHESLRPGAYFALFENNPLNPGTRWVMSRIPFDRDACVLWPKSCRELVSAAGFSILSPCRFLFYFPRFLTVFRSIERRLVNLPLGAQYYVLARRD